MDVGFVGKSIEGPLEESLSYSNGSYAPREVRMSRRLGWVGLLMGMAVSAGAVGSGGFSNQVVGTKALGMGNAFAAVADDPSTVFFNPAGVSFLESREASLGLAPHFPDFEYTPDNGSKVNARHNIPLVPNAYIAGPLAGSRWAWGLGLNSPYGLETHWDENGPLRYAATNSTLRFIQLNPVASYRVMDTLSVAGGVAVARVDAKLESRLNVSYLSASLGYPSLDPDGNKTLEGDGWGLGVTAGAIYKPWAEHTFGFTYRSQMAVDLKGSTHLRGLAGASASPLVFNGADYSIDTRTRITFPDTLTGGYAWRPGRWTFASDLEWVRYSTVKETALEYSGESDATRLAVLNTGNPIPRNWKDSWNLSLGADAKLNETWNARGGYLYFASVMPENTWNPFIPENARHAVTLGATARLSDLWRMDMAYAHFFFVKRTTHNNVALGSANGTYHTTAPVVSVNITRRF